MFCSNIHHIFECSPSQISSKFHYQHYYTFSRGCPRKPLFASLHIQTFQKIHTPFLEDENWLSTWEPLSCHFWQLEIWRFMSFHRRHVILHASKMVRLSRWWSESCDMKPLPIGSMGVVYSPTWMVNFYGKCRRIYHTWILWVMIYRPDSKRNFVPHLTGQPLWYIMMKRHDDSWWYLIISDDISKKPHNVSWYLMI